MLLRQYAALQRIKKAYHLTCCSLIELLQRHQNFFGLRKMVHGINLAEHHLTFFINYEYGALADARKRFTVAEDPVFHRDLAMRVIIADQWIVERPDLFFPGAIAVDGIHADAHDLGVVLA